MAETVLWQRLEGVILCGTGLLLLWQGMMGSAGGFFAPDHAHLGRIGKLR